MDEEEEEEEKAEKEATKKEDGSGDAKKKKSKSDLEEDVSGRTKAAQNLIILPYCHSDMCIFCL